MSATDNSSERTDQGLIHEALFYRTPEELARVLREFVTTENEAGEPVLAVLPDASLELLDGALRGSAAQVRFEDMRVRGRNPNCLLALYEDWIDRHDGPVRVIGEAVWPGRSYAETVECLRHEAVLNLVLESSTASILCPYDAERLGGDVLVGAELTHPRLIGDDGVRRASQNYGEPAELSSGARWPQAAPTEPCSEYTFTGDLSALRAAVGADPAAQGLNAERRADLVFAVNEAATNSIEHGDGACTARFWHDDAGIVSEVSFGSVIPAGVLAGRRRPPLEAPSGRGLWLINQVCDLVELRTGHAGTTLRMHLS